MNYIVIVDIYWEKQKILDFAFSLYYIKIVDTIPDIMQSIFRR